MLKSEDRDGSYEKGIKPELKAMLDYFGDRVESVEITHKNGALQIVRKVGIRPAK